MDIIEECRWLAGALRDCGRPALAHLVEVYPYLPRHLREGVWQAVTAELAFDDPRERVLRDAASAIDSVGIDRADHVIARARAQWDALAT
jgi:hypothetical protein